MKNVYDIRYEKNLTYIIPECASCKCREQEENVLAENAYKKTAIILYLYYEDTLPVYYGYISRIPKKIDIYIISSRKEVLQEVEQHMDTAGESSIYYLLKENRGRDITALLITGAGIVKNYQYLCFLHDKKEHKADAKEDTALWVENLWGNLIQDSDYINRVLKLFEENENLGILAPPDPIGDYVCAWYADGWYDSFDMTKKLIDKLELKADIDRARPPVTLGTALWFKSRALEKLFAADWKYLDFDDSKLIDKGYLSYGIERIFAYVAQDAGYDTGTIMTMDYAEKQTNYLQHATKLVFGEAEQFFPFYTVQEVERYKENAVRIVEFAKSCKKLFLYGAGKYGKFCFTLLRAENLCPQGYIVSGSVDHMMIQGLPVFSIDQIDDFQDISVIITVFSRQARKEIIEKLKEKGICHYIEFWSS